MIRRVSIDRSAPDIGKAAEEGSFRKTVKPGSPWRITELLVMCQIRFGFARQASCRSVSELLARPSHQRLQRSFAAQAPLNDVADKVVLSRLARSLDSS
jgi:hypothetical protein